MSVVNKLCEISTKLSSIESQLNTLIAKPRVELAPVCFDDDTKGYASLQVSDNGTVTILNQYEEDMTTEITPFKAIVSCC